METGNATETMKFGSMHQKNDSCVYLLLELQYYLWILRTIFDACQISVGEDLFWSSVPDSKLHPIIGNGIDHHQVQYLYATKQL